MKRLNRLNSVIGDHSQTNVRIGEELFEMASKGKWAICDEKKVAEMRRDRFSGRCPE
jgi:uncharacterized Fe-S cluster protein YjdI